jgi:PIN domain nuclease of toxin-antitoxin system
MSDVVLDANVIVGLLDDNDTLCAQAKGLVARLRAERHQPVFIDFLSAWTIRTLAAAISKLKRRPTAVMHDRARQFAGQVERQLRVLEVDQCPLPPRLPALNGILERTIKSLRWELLDHIRVATVEQLQWYLDEYRAYWGSDRCHQGIEGRAPVDRADHVPVVDVLELNELRRRRLVRKSFAHGLLNSYSLERVDQAA